MTRKTRKINTSLSSCNNNEERIKLLSETREILEAFAEKTVFPRMKHERKIFAWVTILPLILTIIYFYSKSHPFEFISSEGIINLFLNIYIANIIVICFYFFMNIKDAGKLEMKILSNCENQYHWSIPALLFARRIIKPQIVTCEKKLSFLKLFCAALVFLLTVAIYNPPHSIELAGEKILSGEWGELIKSLIFCALTSALITVVLAFFLITYHMQRFLMTDISLKFIISVLSPCNSFQEPGDLISNECYFRNKERNNKTNNKKNRHW